MANKFEETAKLLVKELGGKENISQLTHCATRLRFVLKDDSIVDKDKVSAVPRVITVINSGGQTQVVIGNHVQDAYKEVNKILGFSETENNVEAPKKMGVVSRIIDVISGVFAPFLYTLAACGILQGILSCFVAFGWIDKESGVYIVLNFVSWTAFQFLPVLIAITASKKFGMNTFTAVVIACALICKDYNALVEANTDINFLGIPLQLISYTSSVIPIILMVWVGSYLERFFNKILPLVIRNLFSTMMTIAIMVPLTLLVIGPIGNILATGVGNGYNYLYNLNPIVAGVIVGGFWEVLVIFGVHWGITPVTVGNYASLGYDTFSGLQASAVFAQAGATFGVAIRAKNKALKREAATSGVTAIFGITEPALYGVNLRLKKPMVCACIAGAIGGGIAGAFNAVSWSYNMPGFATIPAYFQAGHESQFIGFVISIAVSFIVGLVLTTIVGFKDKAAVKEK